MMKKFLALILFICGFAIAQTYPAFTIGAVAQDLAVTTTSASATLATTGTNVNVRLHNIGTSAVRFRLCPTSTCTALTTDTSIPPGGIEIYNKGLNNTLAAITASGTSTLNITTGAGQ